MFVDKGRLKRDAGVRGNNSAPTLDTLHQLAASYFMDRESALRQLHHIQITTGAIKVHRAGVNEAIASVSLLDSSD